METRKITIANSRDQKKYVVMSAATTLGELKHDLNEAGINYADMDFIEALTKTQLRDNSSVLPHDVPYNHTVTNELVFLLTTPNRKIKSGISRGEVYTIINRTYDSDELKEAIKDHFGCNYTMVKTSDLEEFIDNCWHRPNEPEHIECDMDMTLEQRVSILENNVAKLNEAIMNIVDVLDDDYITSDIMDAMNGEVKDRTVYSAGMSADDIDELVKGVEE